MEFIKPGISIDFIGKRKTAFVVSIALVMTTIFLLILRGGPNLGVDFSGGALIQVMLDQKRTPAEFKSALQSIQLQDSIIQEFGEETYYLYLIALNKTDLKFEELGKRIKGALDSALDTETDVKNANKLNATNDMSFLVRLREEQKPSKIRQTLNTLQLGDMTVEDQGKTQVYEYLIRVRETEIEMEGLRERISKALKSQLNQEIEIRRVERVGAKVGRDLTQKALFAIFYAILFIAVYISGRFELKWMMSIVMALSLAFVVWIASTLGASVVWLIIIALIVTLGLCWFLKLKYAMGAVVALIHDVTITVGAFALTDREISLAIIAAFLTIVGYSLNDTIVVYDRIRENLRRFRRRGIEEVVNSSINETLSRTLLTSVTTLIVVLALFVLGGGVIHDFAFAMMVGILVGTYSSIFVASPILLVWEASFAQKGNSKES